MSRELRISAPADLLTNIAGLYQSANRVIMEYVDNALDDAEEIYHEHGCYPQSIEISVSIDRENKRVEILDNCRGMEPEKLIRIVEEIGASEKKARPWTNGQFGFGVHAFRACANSLEITTRTTSDGVWFIHIDRDSDLIEDEEELESSALEQTSGTKALLQDFEKDWWAELNAEELVSEIETHFGHLLARDDIHVQVVENGSARICKAFDIDLFDGEEFSFDLTKLQTRGITTTLPQPVEIRLKVCDRPMAGKQPLFVNKGRRIEEAKRLKSFYAGSRFRGKVWAHPNLIGHIELNGNIEPTLDRADFRRTRKRGEIYTELYSLENKLHDRLSKLTQTANAENLSKLSDVLARMLSQLAREDQMMMREALAMGEGDSFVTPSDGSDISVNLPTPSLVHGKTPAKEMGKENTGVTKSTEGIAVKRRRQSGFDIRFDDTALDALINEEDESIPRSIQVEGTIIIYVNHPDFTSRVERFRDGRIKFSSRLAAYIASIIAKHYKDAFYEKNKLQPIVRRVLDNRVAMFDDHLSFTCRFDDLLQDYVGKDLENLEEAPSDVS